jgi:hypothetical protein
MRISNSHKVFRTSVGGEMVSTCAIHIRRLAKCFWLSAMALTVPGCENVSLVSLLEVVPPNLAFVIENPDRFDSARESNMDVSRSQLAGCWGRVNSTSGQDGDGSVTTVTVFDVLIIDNASGDLTRETQISVVPAIVRPNITVTRGMLRTISEGEFAWSVGDSSYAAIGDDGVLSADVIGLISSAESIGETIEIQFLIQDGVLTAIEPNGIAFVSTFDGSTIFWNPFECVDE